MAGAKAACVSDDINHDLTRGITGCQSVMSSPNLTQAKAGVVQERADASMIRKHCEPLHDRAMMLEPLAHQHRKQHEHHMQAGTLRMQATELR